MSKKELFTIWKQWVWMIILAGFLVYLVSHAGEESDHYKKVNQMSEQINSISSDIHDLNETLKQWELSE